MIDFYPFCERTEMPAVPNECMMLLIAFVGPRSREVPESRIAWLLTEYKVFPATETEATFTVHQLCATRVTQEMEPV